MIIFSKVAFFLTAFCTGYVFGTELQSTSVTDDFAAGDLLYGLQKPTRAIVLPHINRNITPKSGFMFEIPHEGENKSTTSTSVAKPRNIAVPVFLPEKIMYTTADVYNRFISSSVKNSRDTAYLKFMLQQGDIPEDLTKAILTNMPIYKQKHLKFLCKRAIDFTVSLQGTIRFLLDGLVMSDVTSKSNKYGPSFTASELRYIYRNWERLEQHVVFYENGKKLDRSPWQIHTHEWEQYNLHRQQKISGAVKATAPLAISSEFNMIIAKSSGLKRRSHQDSDSESVTDTVVNTGPIRKKPRF